MFSDRLEAIECGSSCRYCEGFREHGVHGQVEADPGPASRAEPHPAQLGRMRVDIVQRDAQFTRELASADKCERGHGGRIDDLDHPASGHLGDCVEVSNRQRSSRESGRLVAWVGAMTQSASHAAGSGRLMSGLAAIVVMLLSDMAMAT